MFCFVFLMKLFFSMLECAMLFNFFKNPAFHGTALISLSFMLQCYTETALPTASSYLMELRLANLKIFHIKEFNLLKYTVHYLFTNSFLRFSFLPSAFSGTSHF